MTTDGPMMAIASVISNECSICRQAPKSEIVNPTTAQVMRINSNALLNTPAVTAIA